MIGQGSFTRLIATVLSIAAAVCIVLSLSLSWVSGDAPYYLAIARDLSDGKVLYRDVICDYTPLAIGSFGALYDFFGDVPYEAMLGYQLIIVLACAGVLYGISRRSGHDAPRSLLASAVLVMAILSSDGNYINLEVFSLLFVFAAAYVALIGDRYFLAGILLGCSFLCKQYGVLNFVPFALYGFVVQSGTRAKILRVGALSLGGVLVFTSFIAYYLFIREVELAALWRQITNANYVDHVINRQRPIVSLIIGAKVFLLLLAPLIFFSWKNRAKVSRSLALFVICGILACLVPIYYQGFQHYYLNTFPYLFIGFIHVYSSDSGSSVSVAFVGIAIIAASLLVARLIRYADVDRIQQDVAIAVSSHVSPGAHVYLDPKVRFLYVLNEYRNPYASTIGYDYTFNKTETLLDTNSDVTVVSTAEFSSGVRTALNTPIGMVYIYRSGPR